MKKILSLLLAAVTAVSLTSCSSSITGPDFSQEPTSTAEISAQTGSTEDAVSIESPQQTADNQETPVPSQSSGEITDSSEISENPAASDDPPEFQTTEPEQTAAPDENGSYTSRDDVALYIHTYGHLPQNFITKKEARELGWNGGSVEDYAPGKCIGGDHFGNYEGLLPDKPGRSYTECDIDTLGKNGRGAKRIIFSNDGLIYYTEDHYASFTLLYGEE